MPILVKNTSINRISEKLLSFDKRGADEIEMRQNMLVELALDVWKITKIT